MNDSLNLLVTILYRGNLLKAAVQLPGEILGDEDPLDAATWCDIHDELPAHVQSCGVIVAVERIFEISIVEL